MSTPNVDSRINTYLNPLEGNSRLSTPKSVHKGLTLNANALPVELIKKIFEQIDLTSLIQCSRVCKNFRSAVANSEVFQNLSRECQSIKANFPSKIVEIFGGCKFILELKNLDPIFGYRRHSIFSS